MRALSCLSLAALLLAGPSAHAFNLNDAAKALGGGSTGTDAASLAGTPQASGLLDALTGQLGVSPQQAAGGSGALFGLAQNQLSSSDYSQLLQSVPGLDGLTGSNALSGLGGAGALLGKAGGASGNGAAAMLGNVDSMGDVNSAFSALGMDSGMVDQFAPVILDYLGQQGVGGPLLQNLGSLWGVSGG